MRGVPVRVVTDVERTFILPYLYAERLASSSVDHCDPEPSVDLAPKQSNLNTARQATVEFAY